MYVYICVCVCVCVYRLYYEKYRIVCKFTNANLICFA